MSTIVTPDTLLRWYRKLVAQKYDGSSKRGPGRPRIAGEIPRLIVDNPRWGYTRIQGALQNLGYVVGRSTVKRVLAENGIDLHVIPLGERHLRRVVREYLEHYHFERNHQGLGNRLIEPSAANPTTGGPVECHERLGGLLRYYQRAA